MVMRTVILSLSSPFNDCPVVFVCSYRLVPGGGLCGPLGLLRQAPGW